MSGDAKSIYDSLGGRYDQWAAVIAGTFPLTRLRKQVLRDARGDALELAVGTGNNLPYYPIGVRLTGVDFSRPMLEIAERRALALGVDFTGLTADAEALPFAAARFDTVVCTLAACTFLRPDRVFAEMRRVLRPDGVALLVEHVQAEGARLGLMGAVADAALARGGRVVGVMPRMMERYEIAHGGLSELVWTEDLHDRKREMAARADAFVVLPGGFGTLEEALEVISWKQMRMFDKPIVLIDTRGFFQPLVALAAAVVREGFAYARADALFTVVSRVEEVVRSLAMEPAAIDRI